MNYIRVYIVLFISSVIMTFVKLSGLSPFFNTFAWWRVLTPALAPPLVFLAACIAVAIGLVMSWGAAILINIICRLSKQPNYKSKTIL